MIYKMSGALGTAHFFVEKNVFIYMVDNLLWNSLTKSVKLVPVRERNWRVIRNGKTYHHLDIAG